MDYVAQLTGSAEHIGIGTDMSIGSYPPYDRDPFGAPAYPNFTDQYNRHVTADTSSSLRYVEGYSDYAEIVQVADRLLARGYTDDDVRNILGENFLRVFAQVFG